MMDIKENVRPGEEVYRAVKRSKPSCIDEKRGRVTSALFKDEQGVSVDRQGGRTRRASTEAMQKYFQARLKAVAMVQGKDIADAHVQPIPAPSVENAYHMELFADMERTPVTQLQALQLADAASIILWEKGVAWTR